MRLLVGIKPLTLRYRVWCSAEWSNQGKKSRRAMCSLKQVNLDKCLLFILQKHQITKIKMKMFQWQIITYLICHYHAGVFLFALTGISMHLYQRFGIWKKQIFHWISSNFPWILLSSFQMFAKCLSTHLQR